MKKNVVKTMSVGLSLAMAASPMTAFAEEMPSATVASTLAPAELNVVQDTNVSEKAAAANATELNDTFNLSGGAQDNKTKAIIDETAEAVAEELKSSDVDAVVEDVKGLSDSAAIAIDQAESDSANIVDAAKDMDSELAEMKNNANDITIASAEASNKANVAKNAADDAVSTVQTGSKSEATESIATAQESVEEAEQVLAEKEEVLRDTKAAYELAKINYEAAAERYDDAVDATTTDLNNAEADLADAQTKLAELEAAVRAAEQEYKEAQADVLYLNDQNVVSAENTSAYVKAVLKNYMNVEGTIEDITEGDANIKVTNGEQVKRYSYKVDETTKQISIYEVEYRYEYTDTDNKVVSVDENEFAGLIESGKVVYRYALDGKFYTKAAYDAAVKSGKIAAEAKPQVDYIVLGTSTDEVVDGIDAEKETTYSVGSKKNVKAKESEEVKAADAEATVEYCFDEAGNYVKKVTYPTTHKTYTYTVSSTPIEKKSIKTQPTVEGVIAAEVLQNKYDTDVDITKYWVVNGFYVPRYINSSITFKEYEVGWGKPWKMAENAKEAAKNKIKEGSYLYYYNGENISFSDVKADKSWYDMYYTITGKINGNFDKASSETYTYAFWRFKWLTDLFDGGSSLKDKVQNLSNDELKTLMDIIDEQGRVAYSAKQNKLDIWDYTIKYLEAKNVKNKEVADNNYITNEQVIRAAVNENYDASVSRLDVEANWKYLVNYVTQEVETRAGKFETDTTYNKIDYNNTYRVDKDTTATFDSEDSKYTSRVTAVKAKLAKYTELLNQLTSAKAAVKDAQDKVTVLQGQIDDLNKTGAASYLDMLMLESQLEAAETQYSQAKETFAVAVSALKDAKNAFAAKYPAPVASDNGSSYRPAVATPVVEAEEEVAVIADAAVPAAARRVRRAAANTTTIADDATPLAGDQTEAVEAEEQKDEVATIADDKTPLAAGPEKSSFAKTWWGWLLLIIALIGGAVAYSKKRVEDKLSK